MFRESRNDGFHRPGEELGEGKRLAGIATHRCWLGGVQIGEYGLVESQVCPASKETEKG